MNKKNASKQNRKKKNQGLPKAPKVDPMEQNEWDF